MMSLKVPLHGECKNKIIENFYFNARNFLKARLGRPPPIANHRWPSNYAGPLPSPVKRKIIYYYLRLLTGTL